MIRIGDKLFLKPEYGTAKGFETEPQECTVISVNRKHHWFRALFKCAGGEFKEAFGFNDV